jgi:pyrroloquinoline quinone biosynthesis protein B
MGHLPQSGDDGMLAWLKTVERPRKMLIHINNTNPILIEDSPERAEVEAQGIEVAVDGLEFDVEPRSGEPVTGGVAGDVAS